MADKLLYILKDYTQKLSFKITISGWNVNENLINQNSIKVCKVVEANIRKVYYKTLGTCVISVPFSLPTLKKSTFKTFDSLFFFNAKCKALYIILKN